MTGFKTQHWNFKAGGLRPSHLSHFGLLFLNYVNNGRNPNRLSWWLCGWMNATRSKTLTFPNVLKAHVGAGLNALKIKGDRHQKRARSPQEAWPAATRFPGTSRWPRRGWAGRVAQGAAAQRGRSRLPTILGISGAPRDRAPERRRATRAQTPGLPLARATGLVGPRLGPRSCSEAQAQAGLGERPPRPDTAGLAAFAAPLPLGVPLPGAPPAPRLPGSCTPGSRGGGAAVTHLRAGGWEPGGVSPPGKVLAATAAQLPNSRSCACGTAIAQPPSFPSFKPPANGGAKPRESACSRLPRGPPGWRARALARGAQAPT